MNRDKLKIVQNPVVLTSLYTLRDKDTKSSEMRVVARKITRCLLYEASKSLPLIDKEVTTPLTTFTTKVVDDSVEIIISPILRAGLIFTDEAVDMLPQAVIRHVGMYRDEATLKPVWYYNKLPKTLKDAQKTYVFITDPMLATGNSLLETVNLYIEKGVPIENIKAISIISAPEGINNLHSHYPNLEIITATLDDYLDERGFIIPGLGDAGDRMFNTL